MGERARAFSFASLGLALMAFGATCTIHNRVQRLADLGSFSVQTSDHEGRHLLLEASQRPEVQARERVPVPNFYAPELPLDADGPRRKLVDIEARHLQNDRYELFVPPNTNLEQVFLAVLCECHGCRCGPCADPKVPHYVRLLEDRPVAYWSKELRLEFHRGPLPSQAGAAPGRAPELQKLRVELSLPHGPGQRVLPGSERLIVDDLAPEALRGHGWLLEVTNAVGGDGSWLGWAVAKIALPPELVARHPEGRWSVQVTIDGPCPPGASACNAPPDLALALRSVRPEGEAEVKGP